MSSQPQRLPEQQRKDGALLVDALKSDGKARRQLAARDSQIEQARALGAREFVYTWYTEDDREADMRVLYLHDEEPEVLASQLMRIDYREPTAHERVRYEEQFDDELADGGELRSEVVTFLQ